MFSGVDAINNIQYYLANIFSLLEHSLLILPVTLKWIPLLKELFHASFFLNPAVTDVFLTQTAMCIQQVLYSICLPVSRISW